MSEAREPKRFEIRRIPVDEALLKLYPHLETEVFRVWDKVKERYVPFSNTTSPRKAQHMLQRIRDRAGEQ